MFKDTIRGLDKLFKDDIDRPKVILVTGPPGAMKSSFIYSLMSAYLSKHQDEFGLYCTLEENVESHLRNMESLGIVPPLNLQITDFSNIRSGPDELVDYVELTIKMLQHFKEKFGDKFTVFAFDSLGALYSVMEDVSNMRRKMFHFFKYLRELNLYSFLIMERSLGGESNLLGNEGFLSDGIIMLGLKRKQGKLMRYIQIEKMRATKHSMEMHALEVMEGGIVILGPIFDN